MKQTTVAVIDPVTMSRLGLKSLLEHSKYGFTVIGEYYDIPSFRKSTNRQADIILVNPCTIGFSASFDIRKLLPDNQSSVIIAMSYEYLVPTALNSFDGVLNIYEDQQAIERLLVDIYERFISRKNAVDLDSILTLREREVMAELHNGLRNPQIAEKLCISVHTVKTHRRNICSKTKGTSAAERATYLLNNKLIGFTTVPFSAILYLATTLSGQTQTFLSMWN